MPDTQLRLSAGFQCLRCGAPCKAALSGDLLIATCAGGDLRYVFTVRPPGDAPTVAKEDPLLGQTLGPCRLVARAGTEGGLPIYQGLDTAHNRPCTVRVLHGPAAREEERFRDFVRTAKLSAAAGRHPALGAVTHLARFQDGAFTVAPALEGQTFEQAVRGVGRMRPAEALRLVRRLAEALAELHERRIIHRNVGPYSVFILPGGEPMLRNFAFAVEADRRAGAHEVVGQLGFFAPEQIMRNPLDGRADLYGLGALLYFALVGQPPFVGATPSEIIRSQLAGPRPTRDALAISAPPELTELVMSLMDENPSLRPANARALVDKLGYLTDKLAVRPAPAAGGPTLDEAKVTLAEPAKPPAPAHRPARDPYAPLSEQEAASVLPTQEAGLTLDSGGAADEGRARLMPTFELKPLEGPPPPGVAPAPRAAAAAEALSAAAASPDANLVLETDRPPAEGKEKPAEAILLPDSEPRAKLLTPRAIVLMVLVGIGLTIFLATRFVSCGGEEPKAQVPGDKGRPPSPKPGKKGSGGPAKAMSDAQREFAALEALAKRGPKDPEELLKLCDAFLEKYRTDELAAAATKIRDDFLGAQREKEADADFRALQGALREKGKNLVQQLEEMDAFIKKHRGTKVAAQAAKLREQMITQQEGIAERAAAAAAPQIERLTKAETYGAALALLTTLADAQAGTKVGAAAATQAAELRRKLLDDFKARKATVEQLVRRACFGDALAQLDAPLARWQFEEARREATELAATLRLRRTKVVEAYGTFLGSFSGLLGAGKYEEARTAAAEAAGKAEDPLLRDLLQGKAADAATLVLALKRVAAGAKAEQAKAAQGDGKIWLQRPTGARLKALITNVAADGLDAEMLGFKGHLGWGDLHPDQLVVFARSAPGEANAAEHCATGLLGLYGGALPAAFEEFTKAVELDPSVLESLLGSLRRHAQGFVYVPAGQFLAGPRKEPKTLEGYLLGCSEVTNAEFAFFVRVTKAQLPGDWKAGRDDQPVANVTWQEADAFARWLDMRLPTDLEWERAVRGTDGRLYPWGNTFEAQRAVFARPAAKGPGPTPSPLLSARRHPRRDDSPFYHLVGNVREWTGTPALDPRGAVTGYMIVGGSAADPEALAVAHARLTRPGETRDPYTGFRLAWPR